MSGAWCDARANHVTDEGGAPLKRPPTQPAKLPPEGTPPVVQPPVVGQPPVKGEPPLPSPSDGPPPFPAPNVPPTTPPPPTWPPKPPQPGDPNQGPNDGPVRNPTSPTRPVDRGPMPSDPSADQQIMMAPGVTLQDVDSNAQNYQDFMASQLLGGMTQADLTADMPPMQRRNPMEMPEVDGGPMQIPRPPMGPMGGPFDAPYDPNAPNTPNAPMNEMPRPPQRNPLDTDVEYEQPGSTQIPRPDQRGPQRNPFDQDTRGRDGQFPTMEQQLDNSMEGMFGQQMGNRLQNLSAQAQGASSPQTREANSRTDGTYSPQASRMQQGPEVTPENPMFGQEGYGDMIRQRRAEQGGPKTLADLRGEAEGKMPQQSSMNTTTSSGISKPSGMQANPNLSDIAYGKSGAPQMTPAEVRQRQTISYNQSRQPTEAEKTFMMSQGNRRNPGSMDMSLLRKPQVTRKPTASTTVNLRTPNQGVKQQFTANQNLALGNTMQTSPYKANLMRNAANRYNRQSGLSNLANRAKTGARPLTYG